MIKNFFKKNKLILFFLIIGILYRIYLTSGGTFIFNMDNARDFVDVRGMVELHKIRLIGPTSAIQGLFTGPAWYYLLAIPYIATHGNPYGAILMEFILWAIGGFYLLKIAGRYGRISLVMVGISWVASNIILLATAYSFNPNPVTLLSPLFLYLLLKYLETKKVIYSIGAFFLGGLFFNFEMNMGIFSPFIIIGAIFLSKKFSLFKEKSFWIGSLFFIICLLPQALFELKHQFLMTNSVINYLRNPSVSDQPKEVMARIPLITNLFYGILVPGFMNNVLFTKSTVLLFIIWVFGLVKNRSFGKDLFVPIVFAFLLVPYLGYVILPVTVNSWHLGGVVDIGILLSGILISKLFKLDILGKLVGIVLITIFLFHATFNIFNYLKDSKKPSTDPSLYKNELSAIDYLYSKANGKNFKVYTYLPSITDYPYQYLFWWRGINKYGYTPKVYAYAITIPPYIEDKEKLPTGANPPYDGLVFLLKQPDTRGDGHLWINQFKIWDLKQSEKFGPYTIETRQESTNSATQQ